MYHPPTHTHVRLSPLTYIFIYAPRSAGSSPKGSVKQLPISKIPKMASPSQKEANIVRSVTYGST